MARQGSETERDRRARLATALRENLKRRKAQARATTPGSGTPRHDHAPHDAARSGDGDP